MQRKEVKIGVAVVAVLILVLIAYVLVVPGGQSAPSQVGADDPLKPLAVAPEPVQPESARVSTASNEPAVVEGASTVASGAKPADPFGPPDERWMLALNTGALPQTKVTPDRSPGSAIRTETPTRPRSGDASVGANSAAALNPATRPASTRTHTVQPGESLARIAENVYGSQVYYKQILAANPSIKPEKLKPGTVIQLPDIASVKAAGGTDDDSPLPAVDPRTEYRVQPGENLSRIAVKLYGKSEMWESLYQLNQTRIGDDPAKLKVGMVLQLPSPPTRGQ